MNRTVLAVRHVVFEDLGILAPLLTERSYEVSYFDAGIDLFDTATLSAADLVVILGGPIGVYDTDRYPFLAGERAALETRLTLGKPTLGMCLGAQLIAQALGAEVISTGRVEIGYSLLTLTDQGHASVLAGLESVPVLHWHGDEFDIPLGRHVSRVRLVSQIRPFPSGSQILGLQFHLEAEHTEIERWLIGHAHELAAHQIDPGAIRRDAARFGPDLARIARPIFAAWLDQL